MAAWRQVSPNEAMQHPLYGVGGWLLFFMILQIIGVVFYIYNLTQALDTFQIITSIVSLVVGLLIVLLCFSKSRSFPTVAIVLMWINVGVTVIGAIIIAAIASDLAAAMVQAAGGDAAMADMVSATIVSGLIVAVIVAAVLAILMTWYLIASKRVNVTYRFRVQE